MVIDLTYTDGDRYYDQNILREHNIAVVKIKCAGGPNEVPSRDLLQTFIAAVDNFLRSPASRDGLIGVHCTHGLNRTGYFICKYMTDRMSVRPQRAIEDFEKARGHKISRPRLVADIMKSTSSFNSQSPLSNCYDDEGASFSRFRR
nr:RNA/RNP complex-1-interacting phosphatase [Onthophagus taurus]